MSAKIIFVGTASGQTSRVRNHTSILIQSNNYNLLIDCGDGTAKALLNTGINFNTINTILLTHYHADHFTGLPSLITQMKINGRTTPLQIITHANLAASLNEFLISCYLFKEKLGFEMSIFPFEFDIPETLYTDISFTMKQNSHIVHSDLLKNYPPEIFVSSSGLLNVGSKKVFYTSDIGSTDDLFLFDEEKPDWLITETTHIDVDKLFSIFNRISVEKIFLTHFSDETEKVLIEKLKNLNPAEQGRIKICYDGMTASI